jgi:hypothetical protein
MEEMRTFEKGIGRELAVSSVMIEKLRLKGIVIYKTTVSN